MKLASESASISPSELAMSMFLPQLIKSLIRGSIRPFLQSISVLFIFEPVSLISRAIDMGVNSLSVSFVVLPLTLVNVSVSMDQSASPVCFVVFPVTLIPRSVQPNLDSSTLSDFRVYYPIFITCQLLPFSFIFRSILKHKNRSFLFFLFIILNIPPLKGWQFP